MTEKIYYYEVEVYVPYDGYKALTLAHEKEFDDLEFHSIIQEVIDATIADYIEHTVDKDSYCTFDYWNLWGRYQKGRFGVFLRHAGFDVVTPLQRVVIEDRPVFTEKRYENLEIPKCKDCYREDDEFDLGECPIVCKRRCDE